jgi:uncharacterized protein
MGLISLIKLFVLIIFIWAVIGLYRKFKIVRREIDNDEDKKEIIMQRCDYCGLHLPKHEAIRVGNLFYCCEEHHRLATNKKNK